MDNLIMSMSVPLKQVLSIVIAYLLGSIPTSYLLGKFLFGTDIRKKGSGNVGATNALRTFGAKIGVVVLLIDMLKGVAAILIARYMMRHALTLYDINVTVSLSGLAVILGHIYTVFLGFKGGKGVATAAGVFLILLPVPFIYCAVLFSFIVAVTGYVSLGSMLSAIAFLLIELFSQLVFKFPNKPRLLLVLIVAFMILYRHRENLKRLFEGTESKVKWRKHKESS